MVYRRRDREKDDHGLGHLCVANRLRLPINSGEQM